MLQKIRKKVVVSKKCLRNIWLVLKLPTEEQLLEMGKMFPNLDKDIISSVFVEKSGSQEEVINVLLQMSSEWIWVFFFCLFFWYVKISLLGLISFAQTCITCYYYQRLRDFSNFHFAALIAFTQFPTLRVILKGVCVKNSTNFSYFYMYLKFEFFLI